MAFDFSKGTPINQSGSSTTNASSFANKWNAAQKDQTQSASQVNQNTNTQNKSSFLSRLFAPSLGPVNGLGVLKTAASAIKPTIQNIKTEFGGSDQSVGSKIISDVKEGAKDIQAGNMVKGVTKAGIRTAGDVAGAVFSPFSSFVGNIMEKSGAQSAIDKVGQFLVDKSGITDNKSFQQWALKHPNAAEDFSRILNIATASGETTKIEPEKTVSDVAEIPKKVEDIPKKVSDKASDFYKKQSIEDWTKPSKNIMAGFKKATKIFKNALSKGNNIAETLVNSGVKLSDNVLDGKYVTEDTAKQLREDTGKMSGELLRPSLKEADMYTPRTPVADALKKAEDYINNDKSLEADDAETAIAQLRTKQSALERKYPNGMSLEDIHDEKITASGNAGHNPIGTKSDNISARTSDAVATAFKKTLEQKAPPELHVEEFNKELSKIYQAADYLAELNTKKVPRSTLSKIAKGVAKIAGATAGESLGGGILGGVAGYHLGGIIEGAFENMTDPLKSNILDNLQKTNVKAFEQLRKYLGDQEVSRLQKKSLPAPSPLGSEKNPIITPAPTTYEPASKFINREK